MTNDNTRPRRILSISAPSGKPNDHPFEVIAEAVKAHALAGRECFQKFTCAKCGQRLTMEDPNVLYTKGHCDKCGHMTDIKAQGCNYLLAARNVTSEEVADLLRGENSRPKGGKP
jgi:hypothetical protein